MRRIKAVRAREVQGQRTAGPLSCFAGWAVVEVVVPDMTRPGSLTTTSQNFAPSLPFSNGMNETESEKFTQPDGLIEGRQVKHSQCSTLIFRTNIVQF